LLASNSNNLYAGGLCVTTSMQRWQQALLSRDYRARPSVLRLHKGYLFQYLIPPSIK
jgi:hypothetical protein